MKNIGGSRGHHQRAPDAPPANGTQLLHGFLPKSTRVAGWRPEREILEPPQKKMFDTIQHRS